MLDIPKKINGGEKKNMKPEEIRDRIDTLKTILEELYEAGVIKAQEYNDLWTKINNIKYSHQTS